MKNILTLFVVIVLSFVPWSNTHAAQEITFKVNGNVISDPELKTIISGDSVLVPSKFVSDYLDAEVSWEADSQTTIIKKGIGFIRVQAGDSTVSVNDTGEKKLKSEHVLENGVAYVPLRFTAEALGSIVHFANDTKTVEITATSPIVSEDAKKLLANISHYRQSTLRIEGEQVIYIDPISIHGAPHDADLIFITHSHGDHLSIADIQKLAKSTTTLVIPESDAEKVQESGISNVIKVTPMNEYEVSGIKVKTVPAYNIGKDYHSKDSNWVGYILYLNGTSYYFAGDTDVIPEMNAIEVDVAFLPVGGKYTMTAEEAAKAANIILPKVAVPIHFIDAAGSEDDARKFISLLDKDISSVILRFKLQELK